MLASYVRLGLRPRSFIGPHDEREVSSIICCCGLRCDPTDRAHAIGTWWMPNHRTSMIGVPNNPATRHLHLLHRRHQSSTLTPGHWDGLVTHAPLYSHAPHTHPSRRDAYALAWMLDRQMQTSNRTLLYHMPQSYGKLPSTPGVGMWL